MRARLVLVAALAAATGCQNAAVRTTPEREGVGGATPSSPGPGTGGSGAAGGPGLSIPDAGPAAPPPAPETCASEVHTATKLPLDLLLLVDASASMDELSGTQSKWNRMRAALGAFVNDPASA